MRWKTKSTISEAYLFQQSFKKRSLEFISVSATPASHCLPSSMFLWLPLHWIKKLRKFSCLEQKRRQDNEHFIIFHLVVPFKRVIGTKRGCCSRALFLGRSRWRKPPSERPSFMYAALLYIFSIDKHLNFFLYLHSSMYAA